MGAIFRQFPRKRGPVVPLSSAAPYISYWKQPVNQPLRSRVPKRQQPPERPGMPEPPIVVRSATLTGQIRISSNPGVEGGFQEPIQQVLKARIRKRQQPPATKFRPLVTSNSSSTLSGQIRVAGSPALEPDLWLQEVQQPLRKRVSKRQQPFYPSKRFLVTSSSSASLTGQLRVSGSPALEPALWAHSPNQPLKARTPKRQQPQYPTRRFLVTSSTASTITGQIRIAGDPSSEPVLWIHPSPQPLRARVPRRQQMPRISTFPTASTTTSSTLTGQIRISADPSLEPMWKQATNLPLRHRWIRRQQVPMRNPELVYPPLSTLIDDMQDNSTDATKWTIQALGTSTVVETTNRLVINPADSTIGYSGYLSTRVFSLRASSVYVEVPQVLNAAGAFDTILEVTVDSTNRFRIYQENASLIFRHTLNGGDTNDATITYDPSMHRWWRIRELNGTVLFDTSPNGITWTNRASTGVQALVGRVDRVTAAIYAGMNSSTTGAGTAIFDNVNIVPNLIGWKRPVNQPLRASYTRRRQLPATAIVVAPILATGTGTVNLSGQIRISASPALEPTWKQPTNQPLRRRIRARQQPASAHFRPLVTVAGTSTLTGQLRISAAPAVEPTWIHPVNQPLRRRVPKRQQVQRVFVLATVVSSATITGQIRISTRATTNPASWIHAINQFLRRRIRTRQQPPYPMRGSRNSTFTTASTITGQIRIGNTRTPKPPENYSKGTKPPMNASATNKAAGTYTTTANPVGAYSKGPKPPETDARTPKPPSSYL